ncbi:MAG: hypothetical protein IKU59_00495 [Bacteroidales bacterium]|nr:hypothetical protein [Bacteroidales bacterium]
MGKFIFKISLFVTLLMGMVSGLEYIARITPNSYSYKNEYMLKNCDSINTLVLGSSHSFYGINPLYLENNSFNLANVSQDLKFDLYLLNRNIEKCKELKTVIIPISYFSLYETPLDKGNEKFRVKFYEHYMDYNDTQLNSIEKMEIYNPTILQEKVGNWFKNLIGINADYGVDSLGWATGYSVSKIDDEIEINVSKTILRHTPNEDYINENIRYLNKIAELCYTNNIRLYFITTPTLQEYYNNIDAKRWLFTTSTVNDICLKYDASYYNYLKDERFDKSDFFDADHLCHKGAEKFSKILKSDIFE